MNNTPVMKIGIVAVSRDCFPESLSVTRRQNLVKHMKQSMAREISTNVRYVSLRVRYI